MSAQQRLAPASEPLPIGTTVLAWPGVHDGSPLLTTTRSAVWSLGSGHRVVAVHGHAGGISLTHITPLDQGGTE